MPKNTTNAMDDSGDRFGALAAAVHPAWHQAIIRLANASERVAFRLEAFMGTPINGGMARHARELIKDLIDFLDQLEADPDLEPSFGSVAYGHGPAADECEPPEDAEPSLGSFDRLTDQEKSWRTIHGEYIAGSDAELDNSDSEPSLGSLSSNDNQERWAATDRRDLEEDPAESGIGDREGALEQIGCRDWAGTTRT